MSQQPEQHQMELEATYPAGSEEWCCPICGRRFLLQWKPVYTIIVIEPGDEYASHTGVKSEPDPEASEPAPAQETEAAEELDLSIWAEWLDTVDMDAWEQDAEEPGLSVWAEWLNTVDMDAWEQDAQEPGLSVWVEWLNTVDMDAWWARDLTEDC